MTLHERASRVRLLVLDVDGVLTDGSVLLHADGSESKTFHIRDGSALVWAQRVGLTVALLSARTSAATAHRAAQLSIPIVAQGVGNKLTAYEHMTREAGVEDTAVAYMGDDLLDLPVLARVGLAAAPADAAPEVKACAHWISGLNGGRGAVRELVELVLQSQGRWDEVVRHYLPQA